MLQPLYSRSFRQGREKLSRAHAVLKCLAAVDEYYRHLIVVLLPQFGVGIDVHLAPLEVGLPLGLRKGLFYDLAEMAALA